MKKTATLLLFGLSLLIATTSFAGELSIAPITASEQSELPVPSTFQHTPVWCWAAASAMVVNYFTRDSLADCQVLDAYDKSRFGHGGCCVDNAGCVVAGNAWMIHELLSVFEVRSSLRGALSYKAVRLNIDDGQPMIAILQGSPIGHAIVISGYYPPNQVVVLDPANGRRVQLSYEALRFYGGYSWDGTLVTWKSSHRAGD